MAAAILLFSRLPQGKQIKCMEMNEVNIADCLALFFFDDG